MSQSPNQRNCDRIALPAPPGLKVVLRVREEQRRMLLDVDFSAPRERLMSAVLAAFIARPSRAGLEKLPLADRHWLMAQLMLRGGMGAIEIADVCARCGGLLELKLDVEAVIRHAEPVFKARDKGMRLPTSRDLENAESPEDLLAACAPGYAGDAEEIERAWRDADPLGTIELNADCCLCGQQVRANVDLGARWLAAERRKTSELLQEVHTLARHYHWPEHEILALSEWRRERYIALCEQESDSVEQHVYV